MRPTKISVFGKKFSISFVDDLRDSEGGLLGRNETDGQRILIRDGQPLETEQDTVLHEVVHCIEEMTELKMTERQVSCIAMGMIAVFRDNPEFLKYLAKK